MGVSGLLKLLKPAASRYVDLRDGADGRIIADGHYLLHKAITSDDCATALVAGDDVKPLAKAVARYVTKFTDSGWDVTIVFDGASPPGKRRTSKRRHEKRREAGRRSRDEKALGDLVAAEKFAKQSVSFSPRVVARVSSILRHDTLAEIMTAPYEADGQLKVMEDLYASSARCFVHGTDSDLIVIGVRSLLWEVSSPGGILGGQVIARDRILYPREEVLRDEEDGKFIRLLHGMRASGDPQPRPCLPIDVVIERLLDFSCLAGNDYVKYSGIGPKIAMDIALVGETMPDNNGGGADAGRSDLAEAVVSRFPGAGSVAEVKLDISLSRDMWKHPGVWMPLTGEHAHLSGTATSELLRVVTGKLHTSDVATRIAAQSISPITLLPWDPRIEDTPSGPSPRPRPAGPRPPSRGSRSSDVPGYLRRAAGEDDSAALTAVSSLFPREGEDLRKWNVPKLQRFLNCFRCLEYSGVSTARKAELVSLAESCLHLVRESKPGSAAHLFRMPATRTTPAERTRVVMPDLPPSDQWVSGDPAALRPMLPRVDLSVILEWLVSGKFHDEAPGRVITRGLQRAMDAGGIERLSIVPATGSNTSVWLRLRASASMRHEEYLTHVLLAVHKLGGEEVDEETFTQDDAGVGEGYENSSSEQLHATTVLNANCECTAGVTGGCYHVCMLLQLVRLLQMSSRELLCQNPCTPTGRACKWILDHCRGGRGKEDNQWYYMPVRLMADDLRDTRDPKRQRLGLGQQKAASTRGVVQTNRAGSFNPHLQGGRWAESRKHFDEGRSISVAQSGLFEELYAALEEESSGARGSVDNTSLATRANPSRLRQDSDGDSD